MMWINTSLEGLTKSAAALVIAAILVASLYLGSHFLIPLVLAGLLSLLLQPLVRWVHKLLLPRVLAVFAVVGLTTVALILAVSLLAREVSYLVAEFPKYETNLRDKAKSATDAMQNVGIWYNASRIFERVESALKTPTEAPPLKVEVQQEEYRWIAALLVYVKLTLSSLTTLGLTFLFTIVFLLQYFDLRDRLVYLFGPTEIARTTQAFNETALDLSRFFRLQAGLNFCFGIVVGVMLWVIGLPNPVLWGALAGISRFVPYIGGIIAAGGPMAVAAAIDPGWSTFFVTGATVLLAEVLVGYAVEPLLFGTKTRLSPLAVLIAATFWVTLWGPIGLILALPITLSIVIFAEHLPQLSFLRTLFSNSQTLSEPQRLYHLLLAGHESKASEELVQFLAKDKQHVEFLDEVFLPAMALAANDFHNGVFRPDQLQLLKQTTHDFLEFFKATTKERPAELGDNKLNDHPKILLLAGRGYFDQVAAEGITSALKQSGKLVLDCAALGGLTGISATVASNNPVDQLVMVTVGGATMHQLELLGRRADRVLRDKTTILNFQVGSDKDDASARVFTSVNRLSHALHCLKAEAPLQNCFS